MDDHDEPATGTTVDAGSTRRPLLTTWGLTATMAVLAVVVAAPGFADHPHSAVPDLRWLVLLPLFALAEVVVIHLPTQRNAHGHTLREIPAVLGLTFLAPQQYLSAYVVGAVLALLLHARMRGVKLAFNAAMFALEAALGALTYHAILPPGGDPLSLRGWLAVLLAVLVTDLLSAAAVTAAISLTEGAYDGEVLAEALRSGTVAAFINTCVALLVATLVIVQPTALPLLGVIVVLLFLAHRVYISLARGHAQTQALYRFVDRTSNPTSLAETVDVVLAEATELLHVERAELVEVLDDHLVRVHSRVDGTLRTEELATTAVTTWWGPALEGRVVRFGRPRPGRHDAAWEVPDLPRDGLATLLRGVGPDPCVLVVCDRSFEKETFSTDDAQVFEALAAHAAVALERVRGTSELEALAEELAVARDAALAASQAKTLFLANMGHEIRTPLTSVLASAEMLEDSDLDPFQGVLVEKLQRQGTVLRSLVEQILDFSRIESGTVTLRCSPFDLRALAADVTEAHLGRATRVGLRLEHHVDEGVPALVVGDAGRVLQVLDTLLDNALKFTHEGTVGLVVRPEEGGVVLEVSDTGIGIAAADQESIFGVFSQVDPSATRRYEGTGLGLAICHRLCELMGGSVAVSSEPGAGSTFTVRLPLRAGDVSATPDLVPAEA